ncbi:MAG: DUF1801 domain-containing protein [Anaeromyxobacter sp.]|mgnify:CR=1 FL=1
MNAEVTALLEARGHPLAKELRALRKAILAVDPAVEEAVKWNAPSYRTRDFFATVNLRSTGTVQVVLHTGAKAKATARSGLDVPDPEGLLTWLAKDRALADLGAGRAFTARCRAFARIVKAWLRYV